MQLPLWTMTAALLTALGTPEEIFPGYAWHDLGSGIYVHVQTDALAAPVDGNSTVIVTDQDVLVIDTHINPASARAVIAKIRAITDLPVTHVVNTHWHDDHTNGNHAYRQAFPDVRILAHPATVAALEREWEAFEDQRRAAYASVTDEEIHAFADSIEAEDPQRAIGIRMYAGYKAALESELETMELVYPDVAVDDRMVIEREGRTIVLQWMGRANTDGDLLIWLPDDGVFVTGDVLVAPVPYAFDSPMVDWIATLDRIAALGVRMIIPGHGSVQHDTAYLELVRALLQRTVAAVRDAHDAGVAYEDLADAVDVSGFEFEFTDGDPVRTYAWRSFYLVPGLQSAWISLGYPVPDGS
jgi:glyoxylase-like metal-dependent hydrolase (beta-lactamase superfamily II)